MSFLRLVRGRGARTFSPSSRLRMPLSITSCLTGFPVSPASFAISAALSYPIVGVQFAQAGVGSGSEPPQVIRDLHHRNRDGADRAARFDERVAGRLGLEVILRHPELRVGRRADFLDDAAR